MLLPSLPEKNARVMHLGIGSYRQNAIAIESEAGDSDVDPVYRSKRIFA